MSSDLGVAIILEAHPGHGMTRPAGPREWMRWPEFGFHLGKTGALTPWRRYRDATRPWPTRPRRGEGDEWPWMAANRAEDKTWAAIERCLRESGYPGSERKLIELAGVSRSSGQRAIKAYQDEFDALVDQPERDND